MQRYWEVYAAYDDGTVINEERPCFFENYREEQEEQHRIECELVEEHEGCNSYSVALITED